LPLPIPPPPPIIEVQQSFIACSIAFASLAALSCSSLVYFLSSSLAISSAAFLSSFNLSHGVFSFFSSVAAQASLFQKAPGFESS